MGFDLGKFFTEKPLSAIGYTPVAFYPFAVGLSFFIPLSLSFSIWFFYLFHKVVQVWQTTMGLENLVSAFGPQAQLFGAWFGIAIAALWTTRKFLTHQIRNALRSRDAGDEEARMVKWALIGLIACGAFVLLFCLSAGVSPVYVFAYFTLFFVVAIAISRVRAELGPPTHDALWNPGSALVIFFGTRSLGPKALTLFTMFRGFNRSYRSHPMPVMLEGFKAAELRRMSPRAIILPILLVTVVGTISSAWAFYSQAYRYGADVYGEHWGIGAFSQLRAWLVTPQRSSPVEITIAILSLSFTGLLAVMHRRFLWWPFHPAGYAIGIGYPTMHWYWFSILMSWSRQVNSIQGWRDSHLSERRTIFHRTCRGRIRWRGTLGANWNQSGKADVPLHVLVLLTVDVLIGLCYNPNRIDERGVDLECGARILAHERI